MLEKTKKDEAEKKEKDRQNQEKMEREAEEARVKRIRETSEKQYQMLLDREKKEMPQSIRRAEFFTNQTESFIKIDKKENQLKEIKETNKLESTKLSEAREGAIKNMLN